jgi:hypothetical protein
MVNAPYDLERDNLSDRHFLPFSGLLRIRGFVSNDIAFPFRSLAIARSHTASHAVLGAVVTIVKSNGSQHLFRSCRAVALCHSSLYLGLILISESPRPVAALRSRSPVPQASTALLLLATSGGQPVLTVAQKQRSIQPLNSLRANQPSILPKLKIRLILRLTRHQARYFLWQFNHTTSSASIV